MIGLVVLLCLPHMPGSCALPGDTWLPTLRERLEQAQKTVEQPTGQAARDRERQEFVRRWLELRMEREAKEKASPVRPAGTATRPAIAPYDGSRS
jgi:hypothetical protein